ncbi:MAG TPA: protein kinase [Actinomycetota bacterium]|nr:protein kinase [Actinomycetota bacterium]
MNRSSGTDTPARGDLNLLVGDRYRLIEQIRGGGMGTVWKARDERLGRLVAVKILHGTLDGDETARERFRREAIAASKVSHPAVASIYDYVEDTDRRAIVMELVEGETLAQRIARGPLSPDEARRIFAQVLDGVQAAHDCGVLHRDIKPSNILLTAGGTVKVADFGVATMTGESTLTVTGAIMATPQYAAPEQLRGAGSTPETDVYQTGVALYETLTGHLPFTGDTPVTVAMARLSQDPAPISMPEALPLSSVAMKALERDPAGRFATAAEMRAALLDETLPAVVPLPADATMRLDSSDPGTVVLGAAAAPAGAAAIPNAGRPHRLRRVALRAALLALILALVATGLTAALSRGGSFAVPSLTNMTVDQASAKATQLGLEVAVETRPRPGLREGLVFSQDPGPGTSVKPGATLRLIAADGCCTVPALATYDGAKKTLEDAGLRMGKVTFVFTVDAPPGTVLSQRPAADEAVAAGTPVDMVVARAPAPPPRERNQDQDQDKGKGKGKDKDDD